MHSSLKESSVCWCLALCKIQILYPSFTVLETRGGLRLLYNIDDNTVFTVDKNPPVFVSLFVCLVVSPSVGQSACLSVFPPIGQSFDREGILKSDFCKSDSTVINGSSDISDYSYINYRSDNSYSSSGKLG